MKLIHIICQSPKKLQGEYHFDYFGDFIEFLYKINHLKAELRRYYQHELQRRGIISVATGKYSFTATMDLEQYNQRYRQPNIESE